MLFMMEMLSSKSFGLSKLKLRQGEVFFILKAERMAVDKGPSEERSERRVEGRRRAGQYFDLFFCVMYCCVGSRELCCLLC